MIPVQNLVDGHVVLIQIDIHKDVKLEPSILQHGKQLVCECEFLSEMKKLLSLCCRKLNIMMQQVSEPVAATADDAILSKLSCVRLKYYDDKFLESYFQ